MQFVRATRGEFVFDDQGSRWSVVAPNLEVTVGKLGEYRGRARFTGGTIHFQDFEPMSADLATNFRLQGSKVVMDRIDLTTDGSVSHINGTTDFANWPEQTYNVNSTIDFAKMREIYFPNETWRVNGTGQFTLGGLMGGNYLVATHGYHGFINEVHNNIACVAQREFGEPGECAEATIATGTPVAVTPGGVASGINFALSFGSIVRGVVTDASTGAPVDLIMVGFFDPATGLALRG